MYRKTFDVYWDLVRDSYSWSRSAASFAPVPSYKPIEIKADENSLALSRLRVMGWLFSFHHAHSWQLQDLLGYDSQNTYRVLSSLYKTGMLERMMIKLGRNHPHVYRISNTRRFSHWLNYLPDKEWLGVTGGLEYKPSFNPRHNLAVSDVALIGAMIPSVAAVVGEPFSTPRLMFDFSGPAENIRGDLTFVLHNGLRVVIEATNIAKQDSILAKMIAWGEVMIRTQDPFAVVFLSITHPSQAKRNLKILKHCLSQLDRQSFTIPLSFAELEMIKSRIGINVFHAWIDQNGKPERAFHELVFYHRESNGLNLVPSSLLDIEVETTDELLQVVHNSHVFYSTPWHLREAGRKLTLLR